MMDSFQAAEATREQERVPFKLVRPGPVDPSEVDRYIAIARRMRAQAFADAGRGLWRMITAPFQPRRPHEGAEEPFANSLAAIRSTAELMRDTPDLNSGDRTRFANILLREEARLEKLLADLRRTRARSA